MNILAYAILLISFSYAHSDFLNMSSAEFDSFKRNIAEVTIPFHEPIEAHVIQAIQHAEVWVAAHLDLTDAEISAVLNFFYAGYATAISDHIIRTRIYTIMGHSFNCYLKGLEYFYDTTTLDSMRIAQEDLAELIPQREEWYIAFQEFGTALETKPELRNAFLAVEELRGFSRSLSIEMVAACSELFDHRNAIAQEALMYVFAQFNQIIKTYDYFADNKHLLDIPVEYNQIAALDGTARATRQLHGLSGQLIARTYPLIEQYSLLSLFFGIIMRAHYTALYEAIQTRGNAEELLICHHPSKSLCRHTVEYSKKLPNFEHPIFALF